jgi:hypothetical protein
MTEELFPEKKICVSDVSLPARKVTRRRHWWLHIVMFEKQMSVFH